MPRGVPNNLVNLVTQEDLRRELFSPPWATDDTAGRNFNHKATPHYHATPSVHVAKGFHSRPSPLYAWDDESTCSTDTFDTASTTSTADDYAKHLAYNYGTARPAHPYTTTNVAKKVTTTSNSTSVKTTAPYSSSENHTVSVKKKTVVDTRMSLNILGQPKHARQDHHDHRAQYSASDVDDSLNKLTMKETKVVIKEKEKTITFRDNDSNIPASRHQGRRDDVDSWWAGRKSRVKKGNKYEEDDTEGWRDDRKSRVKIDRKYDERSTKTRHRPQDRRYGRRPHPHPSDRDLPFLLQLRHPGSLPIGSKSHREREQGRRLTREMEEREHERREQDKHTVFQAVSIGKDVLTVKSVDLNLQRNTRAHHTALFHCTDQDSNPRLVVRRGQVFVLTFTFHRAWATKTDFLALEMSLGDKASEDNDTKATLRLGELSAAHQQHRMWNVKVAKAEGREVTVLVYPTPNIMVGEWACVLTSQRAGEDDTFAYQGIGDITVLFNPWCTDDQVYYSDPSIDLEEYISSDLDLLFAGQTGAITTTPWYLGQFSEGVLDVALTLLRIAFDGVTCPEMSDALEVTRLLAQTMCDNDHRPGVMRASHGEDARGPAPHPWRSSACVLAEFSRTHLPVRGAQCWVIAEVFTTVCRALGVPCRAVTGYQCAPDAGPSGAVDVYAVVRGDGEGTGDGNVWSHHTWNEIWVNRSELDTPVSGRGEYGGWQALDCSFTSGHAPLQAVRRGDLSVGRDTAHFWTQVNAEVHTWAPSPGGTVQLVARDTRGSGVLVVSKIPKDSLNNPKKSTLKEALDITHLYKYKEGSKNRKEAVAMATSTGGPTSHGGRVAHRLPGHVTENHQGLRLGVLRPEVVCWGEGLQVSAVLEHSGRGRHMTSVSMEVVAADYTGLPLPVAPLACREFDLVDIGRGETLRFDIDVDVNSLTCGRGQPVYLLTKAVATLQGLDTPLCATDTVMVTPPQLHIKMQGHPGRVPRDEALHVTVQLTNPCSRPLTGCVLQLDGSMAPVAGQGFVGQDACFIKKLSTVYPQAGLTLPLALLPSALPAHLHQRVVIVDFSCHQLPTVTAHLVVTVT